jgi:hypothetical protein
LLQTNTCITLVRETYVKENYSVTARVRICDLGPGSRADLGTDRCNWISGRADAYTAATAIADRDAVTVSNAGADRAARRAAESNANAYRVTDTDRKAINVGKFVCRRYPFERQQSFCLYL